MTTTTDYNLYLVKGISAEAQKERANWLAGQGYSVRVHSHPYAVACPLDAEPVECETVTHSDDA